MKEQYKKCDLCNGNKTLKHIGFNSICGKCKGTGKIKMQKHKLIIKSLHDAEAICTCKKWSIICTGKRTKKELKEEFKKHSKLYD